MKRSCFIVALVISFMGTNAVGMNREQPKLTAVAAMSDLWGKLFGEEQDVEEPYYATQDEAACTQKSLKNSNYSPEGSDPMGCEEGPIEESDGQEFSWGFNGVIKKIAMGFLNSMQSKASLTESAEMDEINFDEQAIPQQAIPQEDEKANAQKLNEQITRDLLENNEPSAIFHSVSAFFRGFFDSKKDSEE
jgi:hypothetical protein